MAIREAVQHIERIALRHGATNTVSNETHPGHHRYGRYRNITYRIGGVRALELYHDHAQKWAEANPVLHAHSNLPTPVLEKIRDFLAEAIPELAFYVFRRRGGLEWGYHDGVPLGTCVHAQYGGKTWTTRPKIEEPFFAKMMRKVAKITKGLSFRTPAVHDSGIDRVWASEKAYYRVRDTEPEESKPEERE